MSEVPQLLTVEDMARVLRTTRKAVYRMAERGQLPGIVRVNRRLLFSAALVVKWLGHGATVSTKDRNGQDTSL
jgi:excisionase family DNA binding protein